MSKYPIYVTKPHLPPFDEFVEELRTIWDSHILTNYGPNLKLLQQKLTEYLGVERVSLFVNGHQALETAIATLQLKGEIITTPFSFASTTHAIVRSGARPVFCDIRNDTYNIDEDKIEGLITKETSAIVPVHVYGTPCNVVAIQEIADRYGLKVIYDAAHAFGVNINGKGIGTFGDISMFSFHATKVFNTIEGGALTYSNPNLERDIYLKQNFGIANSEEVLQPGSNTKMNELQSLIGLLNLKHLDSEVIKREHAVGLYHEFLSSIEGIQLMPKTLPGIRLTHTYFPILVNDEYGITRNELAMYLQTQNIFARKYFYPLISDFTCYKGKYYGFTPIAKDISNRVLCLPLWNDISYSEIELICSLIQGAKK